MLQPLQPGERMPLGYDEWLISNAEAEHLRSVGEATVDGESVPVTFIATWDAGVQVLVPGSMS
jgi:hypothetical protein